MESSEPELGTELEEVVSRQSTLLHTLHSAEVHHTGTRTCIHVHVHCRLKLFVLGLETAYVNG